MNHLYEWFKQNDLPNWIILIFTGIIWPVVLYFFAGRKRNGVPNLKVNLMAYQMNVKGSKIPALHFKFSNRTNSKIYLTNLRIKGKYPDLIFDKSTTSDISTGFHEMLFMNTEQPNEDGTFPFSLNDIILNTNEEAETAIGLDKDPDINIFSYRPSGWNRLFRIRKYFTLEYIALVGDKKVSVKTKF